MVRIESVGSIGHDSSQIIDSIDLLEIASKECLEKSKYAAADVELILYAGVYRTDFLSEPAIAAILAKQLGMNHKMQDDRRTFAFDVMNGGLGFFNACVTAYSYIKSGQAKAVMVATAEIENNKVKLPNELLGLKESAATVIIDSSSAKDGFGEFKIKNYLENIKDRATNLSWKSHNGMSYLDHNIEMSANKNYMNCIEQSVKDYLQHTHTHLSDYDVVIPPQISIEFSYWLEERLGIDNKKMLSLHQLNGIQADADKDYLTTSLPFTIKIGIDQGLIQKGQKALFICAGSGIQVGCVSYQF